MGECRFTFVLINLRFDFRKALPLACLPRRSFDCTWPAFSRAVRKAVEALRQLKVKRDQSQFVKRANSVLIINFV
jgi:hypothetical protein